MHPLVSPITLALVGLQLIAHHHCEGVQRRRLSLANEYAGLKQGCGSMPYVGFRSREDARMSPPAVTLHLSIIITSHF